MNNRNETTGIPYGIISCQNLDPDVLHDLLYSHGKDLTYEAAAEEEAATQRAELAEVVEKVRAIRSLAFLVEDLESSFEPDLDSFEAIIDEPIIEGEHQGVKYRTTWLGGAQLLWVFESPYTKWYAPCSPCVPGAGDLDTPDPDGILCYDVPPDWRREE